MRLRSMMLLAVAAGCGLIAMFLFQQAKTAQGNTEIEKINILVAKAEITPGEQLSDENVEFREFPVSFVPDNAVTMVEEYQERSIKVKLFPGDFVTIDKLTRKGEHGVDGDIPSGMVAISIPVDSTMTSSGLLLPGSRVDVFVTFNLRTAFGSGKVVKTVLEFVEVFATDNKREIESPTGETKTKTVTLLVSPEQAMRVKLAEDVGTLHMAMRSREDSKNRAKPDEIFSPSMLTDVGKEDDDWDEEDYDEDEDIDDSRPASKLGDFLDENSGPVAEPIDTPGGELTIEEPDLPTWEIEIFAGDERRVESVPLPLDEVETYEAFADEEGPANPVLDMIKGLFGNSDNSSATDTTTKTTRPDSASPVPLPPSTGLIQDGYPELSSPQQTQPLTTQERQEIPAVPEFENPGDLPRVPGLPSIEDLQKQAEEAVPGFRLPQVPGLTN